LSILDIVFLIRLEDYSKITAMNGSWSYWIRFSISVITQNKKRVYVVLNLDISDSVACYMGEKNVVPEQMLSGPCTPLLC
jgi:hypothetical protein